MHALDFTKGRAAIAFTGQTPWHGHGIVMKPGMTPDEWRIAAGLDYDVIERPVFYGVQDSATGQKKAVTIPNRKALLRGDTQDYLSIVGKDFKVVQPAKVFDFFRELSLGSGINLEVAGALDGGNKVWALARIDDDFRIFGQDQILPYVLLATGYDGSLATTAMYTSTRVVCQNTLRFSGAFDADGNRRDVYKVRHDADFNIREAHGKLGLDEGAWNDYKRNMENLARFQVSEIELLEYFYTVAGQDGDIVRNEDNGKVISFPEPGRVVKHFIQAYHKGPGAELRSSAGTMFGALQAVTFYQDHLAPAGDNGKRFDSATFGGGNRRKQHAVELALEKFAEAA